jgi:hypothetical protein
MAGLKAMTYPSEDRLVPQFEVPQLEHKYLRASHDYQPEQTTISGSSGGISITAPLREGDIVLIHLTHPPYSRPVPEAGYLPITVKFTTLDQCVRFFMH